MTKPEKQYPKSVVDKMLGHHQPASQRDTTARFNAGIDYAKHLIDLCRITDVASELDDFVLWHKTLESLFRHVYAYLGTTNREIGKKIRSTARDSVAKYVQHVESLSSYPDVRISSKAKPPNPYKELDEFDLFVKDRLHKAKLLNAAVDTRVGTNIYGG